jgi:hypothetical protein
MHRGKERGLVISVQSTVGWECSISTHFTSMMEYAILAFMGRMTAYRQECRQVTLQRVCTTRHEHARDMSTPGKIPDREEVSTGVQEGGGGGESSGPGGGGG